VCEQVSRREESLAEATEIVSTEPAGSESASTDSSTESGTAKSVPGSNSRAITTESAKSTANIAGITEVTAGNTTTTTELGGNHSQQAEGDHENQCQTHFERIFWE